MFILHLFEWKMIPIFAEQYHTVMFFHNLFILSAFFFET